MLPRGSPPQGGIAMDLVRVPRLIIVFVEESAYMSTIIEDRPASEKSADSLAGLMDRPVSLLQ